MTQRIPRRSRLASAIRAALRPSTATAAAVTIALATAGSAQAGIENGAPGKTALRPENLAARDEILFIDAHVISPERLLVGTKQGVETIILEEGRDGLEQITEVLEQRDPVAVHIVAHGESGKLQLGDTWLDAKQLNENAALIRRWFPDSSKADLLLYACKLAEGPQGVAFVEKLAEIAGADVAASDDITGMDGDWDLEVVTGDIEADLAFSEITIDDYAHNLVTFTVTKLADTDDGTCDADCSLREAIEDANDNTNGPGVVDLVEASGVSGTIALDCEYGDIDISDDLTIEGSGITELTVDGGEEYCRIFDIDLAGDVTISDLRVQEGYVYEDEGGCIESTESNLTLNEVYFYECDAEYSGGGLYFESVSNDLVIRDSVFDENQAEYGDGGAVAFLEEESGGTVLIENTEFEYNYALDEGGAVSIQADDGMITIRDSDFTDNTIYEGEGAGIFFQDEEGSIVIVENSYFEENDVEYGEEGGAIFFDADNTNITVRDSEFFENDGYDDGGAIAFEDATEGAEASTMLVENSYFYGNDANYGTGGAINFDTTYDSSLTVQDSQFRYNFAEGDGGGLAAIGESGDIVVRDSFFVENYSGSDGGGASFFYVDTVSIYASTFYSNDTEESGAGIDLDYVEYANIVNSTFSYNDASEAGGGIRVTEYTDFYLRHSTVAFNEAGAGGGIAFFGEEGLIENSILSDNTSTGSGPDLYGYTVDVSFSLISDTEEASFENNGGNIFGVSADLGPLTFIEGVTTPVHVPDLEESPVVDAGDPGFTSPPDFDQRDEPRVLGARTDMGSVEQEGILRIIPTLSSWGLAIMALLMAGVSVLGFKRREDKG